MFCASMLAVVTCRDCLELRSVYKYELQFRHEFHSGGFGSARMLYM